jgi:hypothetical protein
MTDLFLIAHKVRGERAFDVACRMKCPACQGYESVTGTWWEPTQVQAECTECGGDGYLWEVPTSGHRAYPWWHEPILGDFQSLGFRDNWVIIPNMPAALPDHYTTRASPTAPSGLAQLLAKRKPLNVERRGR